MCRERPRALAAFDQPGRAIAIGSPEAAAFPTCLRIVNASVEALRVEAQRIRHPQNNHAAVLVRDQAVVEVTGGHRYIVAEPECIVLVDPRVVAGLSTVVADALEA